MKIIAFGHRKFVGKNLCQSMLIHQLSHQYPTMKFQAASFATKVKDVTYDICKHLGVQPGKYYEQPGHSHLKDVPLACGKTPRDLWIGVGNGIRSATGLDDIWGEYLFENSKQQVDCLIISDLRFRAEANLVKRYGGITVRVDCPWAPIVTDGADEALADYYDWDEILSNDVKDNLNHLGRQIQLQIVRKYFHDVNLPTHQNSEEYLKTIIEKASKNER